MTGDRTCLWTDSSPQSSNCHILLNICTQRLDKMMIQECHGSIFPWRFPLSLLSSVLPLSVSKYDHVIYQLK